MKLVMAMKVRDEVDVIDLNLRYHAGRGVEEFIVTDNGSTDGTLEVLERWRDRGRLRLISEPTAEDFKEKGHLWVTRMGRMGAELGADWVLHADADEFWWPAGEDLREAFERVPGEYGVVVAPRTEFVARPEGAGGPFWERLTVREARSSLRPKLAHRPEPDLKLRRGAHDIDFEDGEIARAGRPLLRGIRERETLDDGRLVIAPVFPARVLHLPLRSFEHYRRRVEIMLRGGFSDQARERLRAAREAGRLDEMYAELAVDDEAARRGVADGTLVIDERLARVLPHYAADGAEPIAPMAADEIAAERADVAFEGMRALTRAQQGLIRQRDQLRRRAQRKDRKLKQARGAPRRSGAMRRVGELIRRDGGRS